MTGRDQTSCPVCGTAVRVIGGDEGTRHYQPVHDATDQTADETVATVRERITQFVPDGFRDEDGAWREGPHRSESLEALEALAARLARAEQELARVRELADRWSAGQAGSWHGGPIAMGAELHAALAAAGEPAAESKCESEVACLSYGCQGTCREPVAKEEL